jgi:hypothetical protein
MNDNGAGLPDVALVIGRLAWVPDNVLLGGRNQATQAVASPRSSTASMVEMHMCRWKAVLSEVRVCRGGSYVRQEGKCSGRSEHL